MSLYVRVDMCHDGMMWDIPLEKLIELRATRLAKEEPNRDPDQGRPAEVYQEEIVYGRQNPDEVVAWAQDYLDWKDIRDEATPVWDEDDHTEINERFEYLWTNSLYQIVGYDAED
jgi:hypothetical protein